MAYSFPQFGSGDPVPWFEANASNNPNFKFGSMGGHYVLLCFFGSAGAEVAHQALAAVQAQRHLFDDAKVSFFGVSSDPQDQQGRVRQSLPGIRFFWDLDFALARRFGAMLPAEPGADQRPNVYRPFWLLLDPMLRVLFSAPLAESEAVLQRVASLPDVGTHAGMEIPAPVLVLPRVFEPEFCRLLIGLYETHGGGDSGFMREVDGKTVPVHDYRHKRRSDMHIADPAIRAEARQRIERRLLPEIAKAFQFRVTRMERYIVACYDSAVGGHFRAHRDNTTKGTAHRRFAVSLNLNAEEFEGGEVRFPEFGSRSYRAPTGGAVVFSCSLLHEAGPVTAGRRYVFLPFLYDEAAAAQRAANNRFLGEGVGEYELVTRGQPQTVEPAPAATSTEVGA